MSATIEECGSHLGAVEIIHRPETHPNGIILVGILAQGNREACALDLQRHIDESLSIALDIIEALEVVACESEEGCMSSCIIFHLLIEHIAPKSQLALAGNVIDIAINLVLVDTLGEQLTDYEEYLRTCGVECKSTCVGHHSAIARHCKMMSKPFESSQLPYESEDEFAC